MTNPVEVIARFLDGFNVVCDHEEVATEILTALEAAGCPVVPAQATRDMAECHRDADPILASDLWEAMVKKCAGWWKEK